MVHKRLLKTWALAFALPVLLLSSCSNDELEGTEPDGPTGNGGDIRFEIGFAPQDGAAYADGPQTKAATDNLFNTTWENGDQIGIFAVTSGQPLAASGNHIHNVKLTYNKSTNKWTPETPLYWSGGGKLDFYAYHPYDASANNPKAITFNVRTDQSDMTSGKSNYNLSDLLTAKASKTGGYGKGETVPLTFSHALAMVQVTLTADRQNNIGAVGDISVSLRGAKTASTLNLSGQAVTATGDAQNVTMYRAGETADGEPIFRALVPAQTVQDNYTFLLGQFNELYKSVGGSSLIAGQAEKHGVKMPFMPTVEIKKGTFQMGQTGVATPVHSVTLTQDFHMSRYQVTKAQFTAFLNAVGVGQDCKYDVKDHGVQTLFFASAYGWTPVWDAGTSKWVAQGNTNETHPDDAPMIQVTWYGAKAYADWVGGSLPTEAQWEYACRAGTTTAYSFGDDAAVLGDYAWYSDNVSGGPGVVGTKLPNPWGLYDMHGNVFEWCSDWYGSYGSGPDTDPVGSLSGSYRVLRGGSWYGGAQYCRSAYRNHNRPGYVIINYGFRVVFVP